MFRLPPPDRTLAAHRRRGHSRIAAQRLAIDALGRRAHRRSARAGTLGLGLQVHARIAHLALERGGEKNAPRLAGPASSSSLAVGTLGALDRARRLLLARCAFLGLVAESSTFAHEEAMAPYIALEASREVTPPSEEEVRAKEEAAKARRP